MLVDIWWTNDINALVPRNQGYRRFLSRSAGHEDKVNVCRCTSSKRSACVRLYRHLTKGPDLRLADDIREHAYEYKYWQCNELHRHLRRLVLFRSSERERWLRLVSNAACSDYH